MEIFNQKSRKEGRKKRKRKRKRKKKNTPNILTKAKQA